MGSEGASGAAKQIYAFQSILVLVVTAEYWNRLIKNWHALDPFLAASAMAVTVLGILVLLGRRRRLSFAGMSLLVASYLVVVFPGGGNHEYLELLLCLLCAGLDPDDESEWQLFVGAVRWMACVIFFWAGIQKLVYGFYFEGQYLAYSISRETYANVFSWLMPTDELARLASYNGSPGTGPYLSHDRLFLLISNLTYIVEIALAPLLLVHATRRAAVIVAFLLLVGIESAAREIFFFFVLFNMLLLFLDSDLNRRLIGPVAVILGSMLLAHLGVLPEVVFN